MRLAFTIEGQLASKSNRRRFMRVDGVMRSVKSKEALAFTQGALLQIPVACRLRLEGPIRLRVICYFQNNRSDLDEQLLLDCLQDQRSGEILLQPGVYRNDRQIVERHVYKRLDAKRPRVEVTVWAPGGDAS